MDPILNCLTGVCCPPEEREATLVKALMEYCGHKHETALHTAQWLLKHFDFAPAGLLHPLMREAGRLARLDG